MNYPKFSKQYKIAIVKLIVFVLHDALGNNNDIRHERKYCDREIFSVHFFGARVRQAGFLNSETKVRFSSAHFITYYSATFSIGMRKTISFGEFSVYFYTNKFER